ncbi:porin family protein [Spirosoma sp. KUDC1026]|uniref:porin family protein n=1 Tax=Spirosoma sp. KUDC1026 TaxID=2745947 RepID=UPI00159BB691|nr:porin family protein [Spirosoma sp. KUDC1026]QKZ12644.1 PorT family protein [Spirosoma sp. KUDC1026]
MQSFPKTACQLLIVFLVSGSLTLGQHKKGSPSAKSVSSRKTTSSTRKPSPKKAVTSGKKATLMTPKPVPPRTAPVRVATTPTAVVRPASKYHIGVRAGVTYPIYAGRIEGVTPMGSFVGGVMLTIGTGRFSFQPELNYARYATRNVSALGNRLVGASDVVEIPLFLKIASAPINRSRFFLNVGPYVAYITSASLNGRKTSLDGTGADRFTSGLAAGAGMSLKTGPGHATAEIRSYFPFGDNNQPFIGTLLTFPTQLTIGYTFPLGQR